MHRHYDPPGRNATTAAPAVGSPDRSRGTEESVMGFLRNEVSRQFIAVPDDKKDQIVYKWPDLNIRKGAKAIVNADELAVFINKGQVLGTLGPGQHKLDADELMFLGIVIDWATGGNAYRAELYFVGTREYAGQTFGGRVDNVQDPQTGLIITLRVFGDYSMQVVDAGKLLLNLVGTVNVDDNRAVTDWMANQLLMVIRTEITKQIVRNGWPILGLSAFTPEIERAVTEAANYRLADYGIAIARMGNFDINLDEEDEDRLKGLAKDTAYSRLAGSFQQYASGQALLGAGEGMAQGGGAVAPAFIGMGMGVGNQMAQPYPVGPTPPPGPGFAGGGPGYNPQAPQGPQGGAGGAAVTCSNCGTANAGGAKFCQGCGTALAPAVVYCANCGGQLAAGARFCPSCGTPQGAPAAGPGPTAEPVTPPAPPPPPGPGGAPAPPPAYPPTPPGPPPVPPAPPAPAGPPAVGADPAAPPPPPRP
jgi:membrane protease subunit (stomatin/prohibitin family)